MIEQRRAYKEKLGITSFTNLPLGTTWTGLESAIVAGRVRVRNSKDEDNKHSQDDS